MKSQEVRGTGKDLGKRKKAVKGEKKGDNRKGEEFHLEEKDLGKVSAG